MLQISLHVKKNKVLRVNNSRILTLRMQSFQGIAFIQFKIYGEIFKSALVYL